MLNVTDKKTWNEEAILQTGMQFLNEGLINLAPPPKPSLLRGVWREAINSHPRLHIFFAEPPVVRIVNEIRKDVKILNVTAKNFLAIEIKKNPLSKETEQLKKITMASDCALEYFKQFEKEAGRAKGWEFMKVSLCVLALGALTAVAITASASAVGDYAKAVTGPSIDFEIVGDDMKSFFLVTSAAYLFFTKILPRNYLIGYKKLDRLYETFRNALQLPEAPAETIAILPKEKQDPQVPAADQLPEAPAETIAILPKEKQDPQVPAAEK